MADENKNVVATPEVETPVAAVEGISKDSYAEILDKLLKNKENRVYRGLKIKNVLKKENDDYTRVTLVIMGSIPGYVPQEDGSYKIGVTSNIYTSSFAISAILKQNEETAMMGNYVIDHPEIIPVLLSGATISVIQTNVSAGEEYHNPFTTRDDNDAYVSDHNFIANNIFALKLGKMGEKFVDKVLEKSVDILFKD